MCSIVMLVDKGSISAIPSSSLVTKWTTGISACSRESGGEVAHERSRPSSGWEKDPGELLESCT